MRMLEQIGEMPSAVWDAFYRDGTLYEGYKVRGRDALLLDLMQAWEAVEALEAAQAAGDTGAYCEAKLLAMELLEKALKEVTFDGMDEWTATFHEGRRLPKP